MSTTVGILLFAGVEELDFAGPWEVFTVAAKGRDDVRVVTIAERGGPLRCAKGLSVTPDHTFSDAPSIDILIVPGGDGTRAEMENPALIDWLRRAGRAATWVASVCTGAILLHAAGFTDGKRVTTHWAFLDTLRKLAPTATVIEGVRYVRDGHLITAAGVSAGIDMSLFLVGELWGVPHAHQTQRWIQYHPEPPYAA